MKRKGVVDPQDRTLRGPVLFIGRSSSKHREIRWHGAIGLFIGEIGRGVGAFMKEPRVAFIFVVLAGIGVYAPFGVWWPYPTTFLSGTAASGAIGLVNSFGNLGGLWVRTVPGPSANP